MTIQFNYQNHEIVSSPTVIVSGSTSVRQGVVTFTNNNNKVYPPQNFEVNQGHFKAIVHVAPGENEFVVEASDGFINPFGFIEGKGKVGDHGSLKLTFVPLPENKPIHLCLIVGRDSNGSYDMPKYRTGRGEVASLDTAIAKLKVAGRLMQAYTHEEMRSVGFSNRSFQFVEETVDYQGIFGYNVKSPLPHNEVKVHVLRSPRTVAQLRDPNLAQQNPKASDSGGLFNHAIDLIRESRELKKQENTAIQCAVIYLDATYDRNNDMILTHAALGGGTGDVKLAIFGSHGLHSWPVNFPQITPSFLDSTHLSKREVANDANECGTSWECLNITLGAFMHEIGHLLGCPHQVDGVMLRDYVRFNRSFMTRELENLRTHSQGQVVPPNGIWPEVCHWNKLDLIRFLYHDSFSLPIDKFPKVYSTTVKPDNSYEDNSAPSCETTPKGESLIKAGGGVYLVEFIVKDLARFHIAFYPQSYGGNGPQKNLKLDYDWCLQSLRQNSKEVDENFDVKVLSVGGENIISKFKERRSYNKNNIVKGDFGLGKGTINGYKSETLGTAKNGEPKVIGFNLKTVYKVRVYSGFALDGVRFFFKTGTGAPGSSQASIDSQGSNTPKVPPRNYIKRLSDKFSDTSISSKPGADVSVLLGNETGSYNDFQIPPGVTISKFHFRNGAWMDAIQVELSNGQSSPMFGNAEGGHKSTLEAPGSEYTIVGMYGYTGSWMDGLGIIYSDQA